MDGLPNQAVNFYFQNLPKDFFKKIPGVTGEVTFGEPLSKRYDKKAGFVWLDLIVANSWRVRLDAFSLNTNDKKGNIIADKVFKLGNARSVIFDSGSSVIVLPNAMFNEFIQLFGDAVEDVDNPGYYITSCSNSRRITDKLVFTLNGKPFSISAYDLFMPIRPTLDKCSIEVGSTPKDFVILGSPFHRGFYTSYSYTRRQIGLAKKK